MVGIRNLMESRPAPNRALGPVLELVKLPAIFPFFCCIKLAIPRYTPGVMPISTIPQP